eukprot:354518-Chlamydomonas_euryale.AAC.3
MDCRRLVLVCRMTDRLNCRCCRPEAITGLTCSSCRWAAAAGGQQLQVSSSCRWAAAAGPTRRLARGMRAARMPCSSIMQGHAHLGRA